MKKLLDSSLMISIFTAATAAPSLAADHEAHHPAGTQATASAPSQGGPGAAAIPRMMGMMPEGMSGMMGNKMSDMMKMMGSGMPGMVMMSDQPKLSSLYLDRIDELMLSVEQVARLKTIRSNCLKDNIRTSAEEKIARLELTDLLSGDNWSLKDAEAQVRKLQTLEGDIQVRHLKAVSEARQVLTPEQLKQATVKNPAGNLGSLFQ